MIRKCNVPQDTLLSTISVPSYYFLMYDPIDLKFSNTSTDSFHLGAVNITSVIKFREKDSITYHILVLSFSLPGCTKYNINFFFKRKHES